MDAHKLQYPHFPCNPYNELAGICGDFSASARSRGP
jgi:hypothetical protein